MAATEPDPVSFELERFELVGGDRLEVAGRWYGVRGRRFLRPSLTVPADAGSHRSLALLDHKPWSSGEGTAWVAAFRWRNQDDLVGAELAVAPDIAVSLPGPTSSGESSSRRRQSRSAATRDSRRGPEQRPVTSGRKPRVSSPPATKAPPVKHDVADLRRVTDERDAALAKLSATERERDTAREQVTTTERERDTARGWLAATEREREAAVAKTEQTMRGLAAANARTAKSERERAAADAEQRRLAEELEAALAERDALVTERRAAALEVPPPAVTPSAGPPAPAHGADRGPAGSSGWIARALAISALLAIVLVLVLMLR